MYFAKRNTLYEIIENTFGRMTVTAQSTERPTFASV
jgi:hypothetical protein